MVISFYLFAAVYYNFLVFLLDLWAKKGMVDKVKDWIEDVNTINPRQGEGVRDETLSRKRNRI